LHLCGVIRSSALRERLSQLGTAADWTVWLVPELALLEALLTSLTPPPDALLTDDPELITAAALGPQQDLIRVLLTPDDRAPGPVAPALGAGGRSSGEADQPTLQLGTAVDDARLVQQLNTCINARRFHDRFESLDRREPITSLPRHEELMTALASEQGRPLGLVVLHIDHAEHLYAHQDPVGKTDLLRALGEHVQASLPDGARLGFYDAACFIVALPGMAPGSLDSLSHDLARRLRRPVRYRGGEIHLTASLGYARTPALDDLDGLWQSAWNAMSVAHHEGGDRVCGPDRAPLVRRIPDALDRQEFALVLQPQWHMQSNRLCGAEALLRWQGMDVGTLAPERFIAVAERHGQMARIGDWVLAQACREAATWYQQRVEPLTLGVNVSPQQFHQDAIGEQIRRFAADRWLDPTLLELELSQQQMLQVVDDYREQFYRLRDAGVRFAVDNLGRELIDTDKLLRCPADTLKIDRQLVAGAVEAGPARDLVAHICALGNRFGLRVVAVGVETEAELVNLEQLGCSAAQGYLLSPPVPLDDFHRLLQTPLARQGDD